MSHSLSASCQLPKPGATGAGERRPIALLPVVYRWRERRAQQGGRGALDEAFELSLAVEEHSRKGSSVAGVFLDCSKYYERVSLDLLETAAREADFPPSILRVALDMY
eukprot:4434872-Amphidinium_carterae.1